LIKDKNYKLIIGGLIIIFVVGLFFAAIFLKNKVNIATNPSNQIIDANANALDMNAWNKIKHRFQK